MSPARRASHLFLVLWVLFLLFAGAMVTSKEAGLSVPDWPLSYGMWMPPMVGNIFYEHGHRMIATFAGFVTLVLAIWTWRVEPRAWVRKLGWVAFAMVCAQGLLGGLTVLYLLPTPVSASHATLGQLFLCTVAWWAYALSREWAGATPDASTRARPDHRALVRVGAVATGTVFVQLLFGAWMRHSSAGLAVPFFPWDESGRVMPAVVDRAVVIHMLHRGFAVVVVLAVAAAAVTIARHVRSVSAHAWALLGLVLAQFALGAFVVLAERPPVPTSFHVLLGAFVLVTSWLLTLRCWRLGRVGRA